MNLLLLKNSDFVSENLVELSGRRLKHLTEIHHAGVGDTLKAGRVNGKMGKATVLQINTQSAQLEVSLTEQPPAPLPLTLVLALPRPKMLRRIFQTIATMGVKQLYLVNTWRVEKSYWQTPWLENSAIEEQLLLGLEQGCDTQLPEVLIKKRFKPFVEDELSHIIANTQPLVAHPSGGLPCPMGLNKPTTLAIGPEGGFIDYEVEKLQEVGFQSITLGNRILRVETAIPVLLSKLFS
jgi:16S rRNA (uracil1498-N3)-methyltransferase